MHDSRQKITQSSGLFVDWLSVWQVHPEHAPLNSGAIVTLDGSGSAVFHKTRTARLSGSHETSCAFKSDGRTVVASGNFGRFNRSDNLFNFDPYETLSRCNTCAAFVGLPLFSSGVQLHEHLRGEVLDDYGWGDSVYWSGIGGVAPDYKQLPEEKQYPHLSRVDLTKNYSCGSVAAARSVIRSISGKTVSRVKKGVAGDASVWWANTRYMVKVYIKALEMEAHGCTTGRAYEYARDNGIIRLELELKRRELDSLGWSNFNAFLGAWDMGKVHKLFADYEKLLDCVSVKSDAEFLDKLPSRLRVTAAAFLSGRDVSSMMSRTTFYRYRKALLDYGIDIADERPAMINTAVRTIEVQAVSPPDWYLKEMAA